MRAHVIDRHGAPDTLEVREHEQPAPAVGEVLVKVHSAALNPADIKVITGKDGGRFLHASRFPLVPGFDFAGTIAASGEGTALDGLEVGQRVYGFLPYSRKNRRGSFAEYLVASPSEIAGIAESTTFSEAASAATAGLTALQALKDQGDIESGQRVLVNGGSGGVGSFAVQIAKLLGAEVWATASASKLDAVKALGADHVIDYREKDITALDTRFDIVLDAAATSSYGRCVPILEPAGVYVTLLPSLSFVGGTIRALFSKRRCKVVIVKSRRPDLAALAKWMGEGSVRAHLTDTLPFDDLAAGLARLAAGKVTGKLALEVCV